ncbi:MAG: ATP-dependent DNA helicase RecG [Clostridia bacterium]|nr:ATP-dependent DNA helicase RecG [Clostridia bacterium]
MKLQDSVRQLYGVGEKLEKSLNSAGLYSVKDMLYYFPRAYQNRADVRDLTNESSYGEYHSYILTVANEPTVAMIKRGMNLLKFRAFDDTGKVNITYFNQNYLKDVFHTGATFRFWGKIEQKKRTLYLTSPSYEPILPTNILAPLMPVYPLFSGVNQKTIAKLQKEITDNISALVNDFLPEDIRQSNQLCTLGYALKNIHLPVSEQALDASIKRLTFDELFLFALSLSKIKTVQETRLAPSFIDTDINDLLSLIPYEPTNAQKKAIKEICADTCTKNNIFSIKPMNRIVVGDVGSGKTLVAICAAYIACKNGFQCALMAPTEILANQHFEEIKPLFDKLGIECSLLTGSTPTKEKNQTRSRLKSGDIKLVIGTHALIQGSVEFKNLALTITDEQHRFGAMQRSSLSDKSEGSHTLVMSATPIPRTLTFMMYGDLDISLIDEMPPGRQKVDTFVVDEGYRERLNSFIRKQVDNGNQVYIVCPTVEEKKDDIDNFSDYNPFEFNFENEQPPLKAAVEYAEDLSKNVFPDLNIAFIHGKLKGKEKDAIMLDFAERRVDILVSTTVIEVGVNVPNATLMIVENAERFGLSQLHQLRGRVGRGRDKSYCILVSNSKSEKSTQRLNIMRTIYDGYTIAEKDLQMRGPGDFFSPNGSVRQSGQMELGISKSCSDTALLHSAFESARQLLEKDFSLSAPEHLPLLAQVESMCKIGANTIN